MPNSYSFMPRKAKEQQTMANWKLEGTSVVWDEDAPDPVADAFDPSKHNIEDVKKYVTDHPDQVQAVYDAEAEGKNRSSLLDWLTAGG